VIGGCKVVRTAVEVACEVAHCNGLAFNDFAPFSLNLKGLQALTKELFKSPLFMLFHSQV
jgi:hypothetical protein